MADVNANIGVNIDTSDALNQLKNLQRQISQFHQSVAKSSSAAGIAQRDLQKNFINSVNAIEGFSAELRTVRTSAESFTNSLEKNKFSIQQYFRYAASQTKTFGKNFTSEFATIEKTAIERVKTLQTQYVKMGRDASGAMQAIAIRPTVLNMKDLGTQTAIAAQKQVLFNQLIKQGSTNLLNFGKNTQWAGRQLMVGFTLPLATLGMTAGRVFMDMEKAALKFKKVYGDLFTAPGETEKAMEAITELGLAYTKYGVAVSDSLNVAADAAAAGFQGVDLQNQTTASLKLSVLGQMELQKALETTIALQNAFRISSAELSGEIDFLNAVENQTVVSLDDITEAVPRVAPVIQALGGDVRDLAFFLAAMKEGGVNAAQGANALKSGLASLINPTERASQMLAGMGINIRGIVSQNQGDLRGTVVEFAKALDTLDPMKRAQAIEQLFGKFQFARISALFDNVIRDGSQASRVLDLAGSSLEELAGLSEKELGVSAASAMNKFRASIEQVKVALAPLGELFLEIATPFIDFATTVLKAFNNLPDGIKKTIGTVITVVGGIGPVLLMTFGLINNGIANMIKFFATVRLGYLKMTGQARGIGDETQYMTQEQLEAAAAAASLDQAHAGLTQRFTAEKVAVDALRDAYSQAAAAGARFATLNPGMMKPGFVAAPTKMAKGGVVTVGGRGNKDTEPALLTPGEAVIPAAMVKKYQPLIQGMIAGNIPGYAQGVMLGMPKSAKSVSKNRDAAEEVYQMFLKSSYAGTPPTNYGHQISPTSGHSFPIFGLGGVYQKGNKQVFVKPVLDEKAAMAEMRSNEISRRAHGLEAPEQRIVVIRDPMDTTRTRRFLALESDLDPKFINNQPMGLFNEEQYFRQLVASLLRVDKDLSGSNVFGNVVADAGPAGVFNRASGIRDYQRGLPSMEDQALINLLGIKGGAKRAFAESTLGMMAGLTPQQYKARMLAEIQKVIPRLKETIASFKLTDPTEVGVYDDMIKRLEQGLGVDWSKFHAIHSAVKLSKPKVKTQAAPLELANGIVSVPGPKGAGDVTPAMLSPGEAVIPTAMAKKYAPLIQGMIAGNIPGYEFGKASVAGRGSVTFAGQSYDTRGGSESKIANIINQMIEYGSSIKDVTEMLDGLKKSGDLTIKALEETAEKNENIVNKNPNEKTKSSLAHLTTTKDSTINPITGEREQNSLVRRMFHSQNKQLDTGQSSEQFSQQWKGVKGGLNEALVVGGLELTEDVKVAAQKMDDEIHDAALAIANGGEVNADIVEKATNEIIEKYKSANGALGQVAKTMETLRDDPKHKITMPPTVKSLQKVGIAKEGETQKDVHERLVREGRLEAIQKKNSVEYVVTPGNESLTSSPEGRFGYEYEGSHKNRPRIPAPGVARSDTYLPMQGSNPQNLAALGVSVQAQAKEKQEAYNAGLAAGSTPQDDPFMVAQDNSKRASPHQDAAALGKQDQEAYNKGAESAVPKDTRKIRGASSDPDRQAFIDKTNQEATQATRDSANIAAGRSRQPRRVTREAESTAPTEKIWQKNTEEVSKFSGNISKLSLGISALSGIAYSFGADLGGVMPVLSGASAALFGLIEVSRLLQGTKLAEVASTRLLVAAQTQGAVGNVASAVANGRVADMFKSMFVKGKGLAGFFTNAGRAVVAVSKAFGLVGLAIAALAIGIPLVVKAFEDQANRINGLGAAANLTEEKLNFLAEKFGVTARSINFAERVASARATAGKSTEEKEQVVDLMIDPEFEKEFTTEISGIKDATKEQANLALESLATQLRNSGFETQAVDAIIAALVAKTGRTDLNLKFNSVLINDEQSAQAATDIVTKATEAFEKDIKKIEAEPIIPIAFLEPTGIGFLLDDMAKNDKILQATKAAAGVAKTSLESLTLAFESGNISAEIYSQSLSSLFNNLDSIELLDSLAESLDLKDLISGLDTASDKALVLQAAIAGAENLDDDVEILENKDATDADKTKARNRLAQATARAAAAQAKQNAETAVANALAGDNSEAEAIEAQITAYHDLVGSGINAALAYEIVGDAAKLAAIEQARLTDATNGNTAAFDALMAGYARTDAAKKEFESLSPRGGGQKSAFQEAIDSLKEQRQEIKNSISAYAGLRSAGLGVAESSEIAKDSMLSAALASQKVGSAKWNQLVTAIRAAKAEEEAWLSSTPEGRAEQFSEVYEKVMDVFNAQEAILEMNNEAATAANRKIIETLEKQIDAYQRRSSELERDLERIAEKEDEINKAYDEKTKALETVKKLNQDIINQQKSQLSIADALSRGDISAAASAMEDASAQFASSQGDATQRGFDAQRDAQLNSLTENGKTRKQIEEEIKQIKKDVSAIEFGALQTARDAVKAADEALETAKENLKVQGQSKTEWENINTRIDASKANAALYDAEVASALEKAKGLVGEWSKLEDTFTTTHVVNTVYNGAPADPIAPAAPATSRSNQPRTSRAMGGYISGPGTATSDSIPAMLSDGEYVIKAASVNKFGKGFLDSINAGKLPGFKKGGMLGRVSADAAERRALAAKRAALAPSKAGVARKTSAASGKTAAKPQPSIFEKALPFIVGAAKKMPIISDQIQGIEMTKSLINLFTGKGTGGDYATLGLGVLSSIPAGRGVSTGVKAVTQANKSIIPNIKKLFSSDPNVLQRRQFSQALSNPAIVTRRSQSSVESMLRENNVKTLFDTGTSGGSTSQAMRANLEQSLFGKNNIEKISYGILANRQGLTRNLPFFRTKDMFDPFQTSILQYGDTLLNLKRSAFKKTSLTAGDSLNNFERGLKPNENFLTQSLANANKKDVAFKFQPHPMQSYVEAQIRGLNPRKDIKNIWASDAKSAKELSALVKELGLRIPVKISPSNAQRETQTVLRNMLMGLKNSILNPKTAKNRFDLFKKQNFNLKEYNPFTGKLGKDAEMRINTLAKGGLATNKFAMGGLVSPKYFAMGGLVSPKYFASGGMIKAPKAEPAPIQMAGGGKVNKYAAGGFAQFANGTDTVPAMLTPGEFVVNKKATDMYGPLLAAMNSSPAAGLSMMGAKTFSQPVYNMPAREYADVGGNMGVYSASNSSPSLTSLDNSVYNNYSLSVNVDGTNASANDIANVVMNKIKTIESQQVRRQVLR
jgi:TP901 family phage tail tape measure protein